METLQNPDEPCPLRPTSIDTMNNQLPPPTPQTDTSSGTDSPRSSGSAEGPFGDDYVFWTFERCEGEYCRDCLVHGNHLIIEKRCIPASEFLGGGGHSPTPFSISYGWGLLPHKKKYIGHNPGSKFYNLWLGPEWNRELFINRMVFHSSNNGNGLRSGWLVQINNKGAGNK